MTTETPSADRLLTAAQLRDRGIPYSDVHRRRLESAGTFPRRVQISANRVAWLESEINAWIQARAAARVGVAQ